MKKEFYLLQKYEVVDDDWEIIDNTINSNDIKSSGFGDYINVIRTRIANRLRLVKVTLEEEIIWEDTTE